MKPLVGWVLGVGLLSCAGPRLPYEARLWMMGAEEQLLTAQERVLEGRAGLVAAEDAAARAHQSLEGLGADAEAEAEVRYAEASLALKQQELRLAEASEGCAVMLLDAARAQAEVRAKLESAAPTEAKALAERAEQCRDGLDQERALVTELLAKRSTARAAIERERTKASARAPMRPRPFLE